MLEERLGELVQRGEPSGGEAVQAAKRALAVVRAILEHRKIGKLSSSFNSGAPTPMKMADLFCRLSQILKPNTNA